MPNWASTYYIVTGDKGQRQELFCIMTGLENMEAPGLHENGFGSSWLGNLVIKLGEDWKKIYCRGDWYDLWNDDEHLTFVTETAWDEMREVRHLLESKFPKLEFLYLCEEPGMGVFITNDKEHKYFPERYNLWVENHVSEYLNSIEELCSSVGVITCKKNLKTFKECNEALEKFCGNKLGFTLAEVQVVDY